MRTAGTGAAAPQWRLLPTALLLTLASTVSARNGNDKARLGTHKNYTSIPMYRANGGSNVVSVSVGTPPQTLNLTATTNEWYLSVASQNSSGCLTPGYGTFFNSSASVSYTPSNEHLVYDFHFPGAPTDSLDITGVYVHDMVSISSNQTSQLFPLVDMNGVRTGNDTVYLADGTSGFWGLGVDPQHPMKAVVPYAQNLTGSKSFTFGVDLKRWQQNPPNDVGTIHWGGVPDSAYVGSFQWIPANASTGWSTTIDTMKINGMTLDLSDYYASFDPGFDEISVPSPLAERVFTNLNAQRRMGQETRWFLGCNSNITMSITVAGTEYAVDPAVLLTSRWSYGVCAANIVSWQNASVPGSQREIRLGTAFLSGVYAAFYHSEKGDYVGLAAKQNAINSVNLGPLPRSNKVIVGAVLGVLLPLLLLLLILLFLRNRRRKRSTTPEERQQRRTDQDKLNTSLSGKLKNSLRGVLKRPGAHGAGSGEDAQLIGQWGSETKITPFPPEKGGANGYVDNGYGNSYGYPYGYAGGNPNANGKGYGNDYYNSNEKNLNAGNGQQGNAWKYVPLEKSGVAPMFTFNNVAKEPDLKERGSGATHIPIAAPIPLPERDMAPPAGTKGVFHSWRKIPAFARFLPKPSPPSKSPTLPRESTDEGLGLYDPTGQSQRRQRERDLARPQYEFSGRAAEMDAYENGYEHNYAQDPYNGYTYPVHPSRSVPIRPAQLQQTDVANPYVPAEYVRAAAISAAAQQRQQQQPDPRQRTLPQPPRSPGAAGVLAAAEEPMPVPPAPGAGVERIFQRDDANGYGGQSPDPILADLWRSQQEKAVKEAREEAARADAERTRQTEAAAAKARDAADARRAAGTQSRSRAAPPAGADRNDLYAKFKAQELEREAARQVERERREREQRGVPKGYEETRERWREREREAMLKKEGEPRRSEDRERRDRWREKEKETEKAKAKAKEKAKVERQRSRSNDKLSRGRSQRDRTGGEKDRTKDRTADKAEKRDKPIPPPPPALTESSSRREAYDPRAAFDPQWKRDTNQWSNTPTVNPPHPK